MRSGVGTVVPAHYGHDRAFQKAPTYIVSRMAILKGFAELHRTFEKHQITGQSLPAPMGDRVCVFRRRSW